MTTLILDTIKETEKMTDCLTEKGTHILTKPKYMTNVKRQKHNYRSITWPR